MKSINKSNRKGQTKFAKLISRLKAIFVKNKIVEKPVKKIILTKTEYKLTNNRWETVKSETSKRNEADWEQMLKLLHFSGNPNFELPDKNTIVLPQSDKRKVVYTKTES